MNVLCFGLCGAGSGIDRFCVFVQSNKVINFGVELMDLCLVSITVSFKLTLSIYQMEHLIIEI